MPTYRITLDAYNSRADYPPQRVRIDVSALTAEAARRRLGTVYVSRDGGTVNLTGGVGADGCAYPEWDLVSQRKING